MIFLNPWGLLGLLSVPIILILHLLRGRTKKISVSSLALWNFLEPEVRGKKFQKIPFTLLLLIDLLIAILLSLALSQPKLLLSTSIKGAQHKIVLIDYSISMQADDVLPDRQTQANLAAIKLITDAGPQDIISVIAFAERPFLIGDTREVSVQEIIKNISSYKPILNGHALQEAIEMGNTLIDEIPAHFYVISDHAFTSPIISDFAYPLTWIKIGDSTNNQAVINLSVDWINDNQLQVFARISNYGNDAVRRMVTVLVDGNPYDSQNLFLPVRKEIDLVWQLVSNPNNICIEILGNDILDTDDKRCLGLSDQSKKQVIFVCDECQKDQESLKKLPIYQALMALPNIEVSVLLSEEYSPLMKSDWTVFQNYIPEFWPNNLITIFFSPEIINNTQNSIIHIEGSKYSIDQNQVLENREIDPIFSNVDFSGLRWGNSIKPSNDLMDFKSILTVENIPLIMKNNVDQSQIYLFFTDLSSGNLTHHPVFPLLFINLEQLARAANLPHEVETGNVIYLPGKEKYQSIEIITPNDREMLMNQNWSEKFTDTLTPGLYQFIFEDKDGNININYVGVNVVAEDESDLFVQLREDLKGDELTFDERINLQGVELLPWLLGFAFFLLFIEAFLSWR